VISPLQVMLSQPYPAVEKHSQKIPSEDFAAVIVRMKSSGKPEKTKNAKANGLDAGFFVSGREKESRADGVVSEDTVPDEVASDKDPPETEVGPEVVNGVCITVFKLPAFAGSFETEKAVRSAENPIPEGMSVEVVSSPKAQSGIIADRIFKNPQGEFEIGVDPLIHENATAVRQHETDSPSQSVGGRNLAVDGPEAFRVVSEGQAGNLNNVSNTGLDHAQVQSIENKPSLDYIMSDRLMPADQTNQAASDARPEILTKSEMNGFAESLNTETRVSGTAVRQDYETTQSGEKTGIEIGRSSNRIRAVIRAGHIGDSKKASDDMSLTDHFGRIAAQTANQVDRTEVFKVDQPEAMAQKPIEMPVIDQITESVKLSLKDGVSTFSVKLKPEGLGELSIHMTLKDGILKLELQTSLSSTKDMITGQLDEFKKAMEQNNILLSDFSVSCSSEARNELQSGNLYPNRQDMQFTGFHSFGEGSKEDSGRYTGFEESTPNIVKTGKADSMVFYGIRTGRLNYRI
jgi:hypothetical protein